MTQPKETPVILRILQSRLRPTVAPAKRRDESAEESRKSGRDFRRYPDGKRNKKINEDATLRTDAMGFNNCPDEKRSERRIACAICNMNRDVSTIVPTIKEIGNKVIITSHFVLFFSTTTQIQKKVDRLSADSITIILPLRFQL